MSEQDQQRDAAIAAAESIGLTLPEATIPGVIANRALLDHHLRLVERAMAEGGRA